MSPSIFVTIDTLAADGVETPERHLECLEQMQILAATQAGMLALLRQYGGSESAVVMRPLTFLASRAADAFPTPAMRDAILKCAAALEGHDVSSRINLLTALQRLAIHERLFLDGAPPPELGPFLVAGLEGPPAVHETAIDVLTRLYDDGLLDRFPSPQLAEIADHLRALMSSETLTADLAAVAAVNEILAGLASSSLSSAEG